MALHSAVVISLLGIAACGTSMPAPKAGPPEASPQAAPRHDEPSAVADSDVKARPDAPVTGEPGCVPRQRDELCHFGRGSQCGEVPSGCPGTTVACGCDWGLSCQGGVCMPKHQACDPVSPRDACRGDVCGQVSAGCPAGRSLAEHPHGERRSLLQYKLSGKETQGRGPIVVCIDQSSSMEGQKEIWSKALALALLQVATMQKRACRVIHFNGAVVRIDDWKPGQVQPMALIKSLEPFFGGNTDFEPPLAKAMEAISADPKLKKADVVLVTDGEACLSDDFAAEWARARKRHEVTCYAVHVDAPGGVAPPQLLAVADKTIGLADVANDAAATDALLSI